MSKNRYIQFELNGEKVDLDPSGQVPTVDYGIEDEENFEEKKGAESFNLSFPPTLNNQARFNTGQNPSIIDATPGSSYDKPQDGKYIANGHEILIGKFFYSGAKMRGKQVTSFTGKLYGLNGDWIIDLKEKTMYDFLQPGTHFFNAESIIGSWVFDGRSEGLDYVYAPVRYRKPFGEYPAPTEDDPNPQPDDRNVLKTDMKPSFSIYWMLYRMFKSVGYKIVSNFMDSDYFRRMVMPWTWGGFDYLDDSRWEPLKFLAKAAGPLRIENDYTGYPNFNVVDNLPGAYDNSNTYQWHGPSASLPSSMVWTYLPALSLGKLRANLSVQLNIEYKFQNNSSGDVRVQWYKNGILVQDHMVLNQSAPLVGPKEGSHFVEDFLETEVDANDWIACRIRVHTFQSGSGFARITTMVEQMTLNYMRLTDGSVINFLNYPKFKNYKILELFKGVIDAFNLQVNTDPVLKHVIIEPTHESKINDDIYPGYYDRKQLDFTQKVDIDKESFLEVFSDYEREFVLKMKDDPQDGGLKKVQDRNQATIGLAKYVLPERFKTGKKEMENRFFSPAMHCEHDPFRFITGIAPQMIAIIPENIANTSSSVSENTFQAKIAWYKGNITGVGGWRFNNTIYNTLPYLFSVNYKPGGENDPILSYADQKIGSEIGQGLLKKFFWQRLAIFRHGRRWNSIFLKLNNTDITNFLHRESIIIDDMEYLLTHIKGYNPIDQDSTGCTMWMLVPVSETDNENTYPSISSIQDSITANSFDVKYWQHSLLYTDII